MIYRKTLTSRHPRTGRKLKSKSPKYYVRLKDATGRIVFDGPGYRDLEATKAYELDLITKVERREVGRDDPFEDARNKPIEDHVADFEKYLEDKGNTGDHVELTAQRVRSIIEGTKSKVIGDLDAGRIAGYLADRRREDLSIESSNHYFRAIRSFCRWLVKDRRLAESPVAHLTTNKSERDIRHARRPLSQDELNYLIDGVKSAKPFRGLTGEDRAVLYTVAAYTGLRVKELASLSFRSFNFASDPPMLRVAAGYSKDRREGELPIRPDVAEAVKAWIGDRPRDAKLWPGSWHQKRSSTMIYADLDRARAAWIDEAVEAKDEAEVRRRGESSFLSKKDHASRFADFHSLRGTFISSLARAGVHPKATQELARHKKMEVTMKHYTMFATADLAEAVGKLPAPPRSESGDKAEPITLSATGTNGKETGANIVGKSYAPLYAPGSVFSGPKLAKTDKGGEGKSDRRIAGIPRKNADFPRVLMNEDDGTRTRNIRIDSPVL